MTSDLAHICQPYDSARTICDQPAGMLVALNYSEHKRATPANADLRWCPACLAGADQHVAEEPVE